MNNYLIEQCNILSKKYIKNRKAIFGDIPLIPQLYWGTLHFPDIIILGKNASYSVEDELDNYHFGDILRENALPNKNDNRFFAEDILTNLTGKFALSGSSRWWRNAFSSWEPYETYEDKNHFMQNVAIVNMYGFYSESLDTKPKEKSYLENEPEILDMIRKHIKSGKPIYIMWKKSIEWWEDLLGVKFNPNTTYIVNGKNSRNRLLKNSVLLSVVSGGDSHQNK